MRFLEAYAPDSWIDLRKIGSVLFFPPHPILQLKEGDAEPEHGMQPGTSDCGHGLCLLREACSPRQTQQTEPKTVRWCLRVARGKDQQ